MTPNDAALGLIEAASRRLDLSFSAGETEVLSKVIVPFAGSAIFAIDAEAIIAYPVDPDRKEKLCRGITERRFAYWLLQLVLVSRHAGIPLPRRADLRAAFALLYRIVMPAPV